MQKKEDFFNHKEPSRGKNPIEDVAYGAAIQASVLSAYTNTRDNILLVVNPLTMDIETSGGVMAKLIASTSVLNHF